jgi:hypothetical protein
MVRFVSVRKTPETRNCEFPPSTAISETGVAPRAEPSMNSNEAGMEKDFNDEQPYSAFASIRVNFAGDSNVIFESNVQSEKHSSQRISAEEGMQIDRSDGQR